ncbi:N-acetylmuramoyl-L-alanine amidase, partial [Bacillus sp. WP8]|uniref:N-acetylmuramoyl-L-alanine amidase n=1 Tax=Bacillus sp. WP8 TaxID=756828 RepID=UPI001642B133
DKRYGGANSVKVGEKMEGKMVSGVGRREGGVKRAGLYVIKHCKMRSVVLESGFVCSGVD